MRAHVAAATRVVKRAVQMAISVELALFVGRVYTPLLPLAIRGTT